VPEFGTIRAVEKGVEEMKIIKIRQPKDSEYSRDALEIILGDRRTPKEFDRDVKRAIRGLPPLGAKESKNVQTIS
jgi:hypothetical protein